MFHCMYSRHRGPRSADLYLRCRASHPGLSPQRVFVLRGGFHGFYKRYGKKPEYAHLFEKAERKRRLARVDSSHLAME